MKKKILITACSLEIGGIERSLVGLLGALDSQKYDVDVLLFSRKGELLDLVPAQCTLLPEIPALATFLKPVKQVLREGHPMLAAARVYSILRVQKQYPPQDDPRWADGITFAYLQAYWDNSVRFLPPLRTVYDAAISFMWPHHYVAYKVQAKKKLAWIHTDHTVAIDDAKKDAAVWDRFDAFCAVSDSVGETFLQVFPQFRGRVTTVENILSAPFVRKSAQAFEPEDMPVHAGEYCLLSVGRMSYPKAFDRVADVCRILKDRGVPFRWYIVGYGTLEAQLRAQIRALNVEDCCILLGKKTNPYPYMRRCDLYLQPSRYEGKAVTVREAQMLGRPVLITDFQTARSQVQDGLDAVIAPQDTTLLADAIESLLDDSARRAQLAQYAAQSDYSNTDEVRRLDALLEDRHDV